MKEKYVTSPEEESNMHSIESIVNEYYADGEYKVKYNVKINKK